MGYWVVVSDGGKYCITGPERKRPKLPRYEDVSTFVDCLTTQSTLQHRHCCIVGLMLKVLHFLTCEETDVIKENPRRDWLSIRRDSKLRLFFPPPENINVTLTWDQFQVMIHVNTFVDATCIAFVFNMCYTFLYVFCIRLCRDSQCRGSIESMEAHVTRRLPD
jgi:hypothetical protein